MSASNKIPLYFFRVHLVSLVVLCLMFIFGDVFLAGFGYVPYIYATFIYTAISILPLVFFKKLSKFLAYFYMLVFIFLDICLINVFWF